MLIVGAGLAGSILAYQLKLAGQSLLLVSDPSIPSASRAAAGLINPVTGQRLVLQDNINALLASARSLYHDIENRFRIKILHQKKMLRLFRSEKEKAAWEKRRKDPAYLPYIDHRLYDDGAGTEPGAFLQFQTGYLDSNRLLDSLHLWFREQGMLIEAPFCHENMMIHADGIEWGDVQASKIIFCEGWRGQNNPWFEWLPFQPAKGEILTLSTDTDIPVHIINRGKWLLPLTAGSFKLGATYDWNNLNETATEEAKQELLDAMQQILFTGHSAKVTGHAAGVRPGTRDKQPFIGLHPEYPELGIFNGFGSKGSLLIPWHAEQFTLHLTANRPLPETADIGRLHG